MKITILAAVALLALCSPSCVHSPARGGSTALDVERDWRAEFGSSHAPDVQKDWRTEFGYSSSADLQPDYREVLSSPGPF